MSVKSVTCVSLLRAIISGSSKGKSLIKSTVCKSSVLRKPVFFSLLLAFLFDFFQTCFLSLLSIFFYNSFRSWLGIIFFFFFFYPARASSSSDGISILSPKFISSMTASKPFFMSFG